MKATSQFPPLVPRVSFLETNAARWSATERSSPTTGSGLFHAATRRVLVGDENKTTEIKTSVCRVKKEEGQKGLFSGQIQKKIKKGEIHLMTIKSSASYLETYFYEDDV